MRRKPRMVRKALGDILTEERFSTRSEAPDVEVSWLSCSGADQTLREGDDNPLACVTILLCIDFTYIIGSFEDVSIVYN